MCKHQPIDLHPPIANIFTNLRRYSNSSFLSHRNRRALSLRPLPLMNHRWSRPYPIRRAKFRAPHPHRCPRGRLRRLPLATRNRSRASLRKQPREPETFVVRQCVPTRAFRYEIDVVCCKWCMVLSNRESHEQDANILLCVGKREHR